MSRRFAPLRLLHSFCLVALMLMPVMAAQAGSWQRGPSVEGVTEYRLKNGLRVLLAPDASVPTMLVNITYQVGSRDEGVGEYGMAHMLEHMLFKGMPGHPQLTDELSQRGAQWNATTSADRTQFHMLLPAESGHLDWAMSVEAQRMRKAWIRDADLKTELTVVLNELEIGENSPGSLLGERLLSTIFHWHSYGRPTIGLRSSLQGMTARQLKQFYQRHYRPDNAVLVIAGRFAEAEALRVVEKWFGAIERPIIETRQPSAVEPPQDGERRITLSRAGDVQLIGLGYPIPPVSHPDFAAISLLADALSVTPSGRLHAALVKTGLASSVSGSAFERRDPGALVFSVELQKGQPIPAAESALLQVINEVIEKGLSADELKRSQRRYWNSAETITQSLETLGTELSEAIGTGDWRLFFQQRDRSQAVTLADIQRVARMYLQPHRRSLAYFVPASDTDLAAVPVVENVEAGLQSYKGRQAPAAGESFNPIPAVIESRTSRERLPSGLQLALLPKRNRGQTVEAEIVLRLGNLEALRGRAAAGHLIGGMLMRGTSTRNREQIREEIERLGASIQITGGPTYVIASISARHHNLVKALELVFDLLKNVSPTETEFEAVRREAVAELEASLNDPDTRVADAMAKHFNHYDPQDVRYVVTTQEAIERYRNATLAEATQFHRDFYGATAGQIAIVGDFNADALRQLLIRETQDWKPLIPFSRVTTDGADVERRHDGIAIPGKESASFLARIPVNMRDDDPEYPALLLADWMLAGGGGFAARLVHRLRIKEGLSYNVSSTLDIGAHDRAGSWTLSAQFAPRFRERLETAFNSEMEKVLAQGFTAQELALAKKGFQQALRLARTSDSGLVSTLNGQLDTARTMLWQVNLERKVAAVTTKQLQSAVRKYLPLSKISIVTAGSF